LSLIFSSNKQQKIEKPSAHVKNVPIYYYKPSKNIHLLKQSLYPFATWRFTEKFIAIAIALTL
jgi:hypothetical protein